MSTVSFTDVPLDAGDMGLVFIPGIGFRPAEGLTGVSHGDVVNACPIKCHVSSYEELPMEVTTYVPMCGGEDGPGKWVEKWIPPMFSEPPTASYYPPVYQTSWVPPVTPIVPWDTPWISCCTIPPPCCEITWIPPETPEIPPVPLGGTLSFGLTAVLAMVLAKKVRWK